MSKYLYGTKVQKSIAPLSGGYQTASLFAARRVRPGMAWTTGRTDQFSPKFGSIEGKYGFSATPLTNPSDGSLSRVDEEGKRYRLVERLGRLSLNSRSDVDRP